MSGTGLSAADLAGVVSMLVFESRQDAVTQFRPAAGPVQRAVAATASTWASVVAREKELGLPTSREPDLGFAAAVSAWADGATLTQTLDIAAGSGSELSAGDFVRWTRQVIDLLDQLATVVPDGIGAVAGDAVDLLRHGVVTLGT